MKVLLYAGRALVAALGAALSYIAVERALASAALAPWAEMAFPERFYSQSLIISIPAISIGIIGMAIWPRSWPLPSIALLWTVAATMLTDPQRFDFVFEALLQLSGGR